MSKNITLGKAIAKRNLEGVKAVVNKAVERYNAEKPDEPEIDTVYGCVPLSAVFDKKTKWQLITASYANIVSAAAHISKKKDRKVEVAKLIAEDPILRNIVDPGKNNNGDLL